MKIICAKIYVEIVPAHGSGLLQRSEQLRERGVVRSLLLASHRRRYLKGGGGTSFSQAFPLLFCVPVEERSRNLSFRP
jgi:hypothetical protein